MIPYCLQHERLAAGPTVEVLDSIDDCEEVPFNPIGRGPGVYFLGEGERLVYIGSSTVNMAGRVMQHLADKLFDRVWFKPMPHSGVQEIRNEEGELIRKFEPKYNYANLRGAAVLWSPSWCDPQN